MPDIKQPSSRPPHAPSAQTRVDAKRRLNAFLPNLDAMVQDGLITIEKARVLAYRHQGDPKPKL